MNTRICIIDNKVYTNFDRLLPNRLAKAKLMGVIDDEIFEHTLQDLNLIFKESEYVTLFDPTETIDKYTMSFDKVIDIVGYQTTLDKLIVATSNMNVYMKPSVAIDKEKSPDKYRFMDTEVSPNEIGLSHWKVPFLLAWHRLYYEYENKHIFDSLDEELNTLTLQMGSPSLVSGYLRKSDNSDITVGYIWDIYGDVLKERFKLITVTIKSIYDQYISDVIYNISQQSSYKVLPISYRKSGNSLKLIADNDVNNNLIEKLASVNLLKVDAIKDIW